MSEIEKMYRNVLGYVCNMPDVDCFHECEKCDSYIRFTAEKQLEIVKMILFSTWWMNLKRLQFSEKFDEGLAQMINELWQSLIQEEKQQVKGILE